MDIAMDLGGKERRASLWRGKGSGVGVIKNHQRLKLNIAE